MIYRWEMIRILKTSIINQFKVIKNLHLNIIMSAYQILKKLN